MSSAQLCPISKFEKLLIATDRSEFSEGAVREAVDAETLEKIRNIVKGYNGVEEVTALHARNSGSFIFVHLDIRLFIKKLKAAHELAHDIEGVIRKEVPFIERVSIHYEPVKKDYRRHAVPLADREGLISEHFGSAPFIGIWDIRVSGPEMSSHEIIENPFMNLDKGKGIKLAELLIEREIDILYTKEAFEGKGPQYVLSGAEIELRNTELLTLNDLIESGKEAGRQEK